MQFISRFLLSCIALLGAPALSFAAADGLPKTLEGLQQQGYSIKQIAPVFSQLLMTSMPAGFSTVFEKTNGEHYIREAVLQGETVEHWSEMLTVTGDRGLASRADLSARKVAEFKAASFRNACPQSFSTRAIGDGKISGYDAFIVILACGTSPSTANTESESALIVIIKGAADYYTIQWAKRGTKSATPLELNDNEWVSRLKLLSPVKLCPIIDGEPAPYPSCSSPAH